MMALWFAGLLASVVLDGDVQGAQRFLLLSHPNQVLVETENGASWRFDLPEGRPTHLVAYPGGLWILDAARRVVEGYDLQGNLQVAYSLPEGLGRVRELTLWMDQPVVLDDRGYLGILNRPDWTEVLPLSGVVHAVDLQFINGSWWVLDRAPSGMLGMRMWLRTYDLHGHPQQSLRLPADITLGVDMALDPQTGNLRVLDAAKPRIWIVDPQTGTLVGTDTLLSGGNIALLSTWNGTLWVVTLGTSTGVVPVGGIGVAASQEPFRMTSPVTLQLHVQPHALGIRAPRGTVRILDVLGRTVSRVRVAQDRLRMLPMRTGLYWVIWTSPEGITLRKRVVIP